MNTTIGNFTVLSSQTLLIPDNSDSWLELKVLNWDIKLKITLHTDPEKTKEIGYSINGVDDYGHLKLTNFNSQFGMSFDEPVEFGETEGNQIYFLVFGHKVGKVTKLDIQFYAESNYE